MDVSMCLQCLSAFCPWLKYHTVFQLHVFWTYPQTKKTLQILSIRFLLDILLWSLAYLKIVIKDKENCRLSRQLWCCVAGIGLWPVCMLPQTLEAPLSSWPRATLMPIFTHLAAASVACPHLNAQQLCCLTSCSTCSNCGASWIVLLALKAPRHLSRHYRRDLQTVSERATWAQVSSVSWASERSFYFRCYGTLFFCASRSIPTWLKFISLDLTLSCCVMLLFFNTVHPQIKSTHFSSSL